VSFRNTVGGARLSHTLFDKSHIVRRRATHEKKRHYVSPGSVYAGCLSLADFRGGIGPIPGAYWQDGKDHRLSHRHPHHCARSRLLADASEKKLRWLSQPLADIRQPGLDLGPC
jgi:hypothetical protein